VRKIVDVFVRDNLRASYPVVIDPSGRAPFVNYVRRRLNRSVYTPWLDLRPRSWDESCLQPGSAGAIERAGDGA
jgi:hypothetical protein